MKETRINPDALKKGIIFYLFIVLLLFIDALKTVIIGG